jgi:hypothetical protein
MKERFISDLGSFVRSLAYSFEAKKGRLDMPPVSCCDMNGCIELFRTIDPEVCRIETYSGGLPDTAYERDGKQWRAISCRGQRFEQHSIPSVTSGIGRKIVV